MQSSDGATIGTSGIGHVCSTLGARGTTRRAGSAPTSVTATLVNEQDIAAHAARVITLRDGVVATDQLQAA